MNATTDNSARSIETEANPLGAAVRPANHNEPTASVADAVLDVEQVASLLRIGRNAVYDAVGRNEIPHRRVGKQIRFSRAAIFRWLGE